MFRFTRRQTTGRTQARTAAHPNCADESGAPDTPLLTELLAIQSHSRHLGWLSTREQRPEEYQRLASDIVAQVLQGWVEQSGGHGTLEDLLMPPRRQVGGLRLASRPCAAGPLSGVRGHM